MRASPRTLLLLAALVVASCVAVDASSGRDGLAFSRLLQQGPELRVTSAAAASPSVELCMLDNLKSVVSGCSKPGSAGIRDATIKMLR